MSYFRFRGFRNVKNSHNLNLLAVDFFNVALYLFYAAWLPKNKNLKINEH